MGAFGQMEQTQHTAMVWVGGWAGACGADTVYSDGLGRWVGAFGADTVYSKGAGGWVGAHETNAAHSDSVVGWVRGDVTDAWSEWAKYWIDCMKPKTQHTACAHYCLGHYNEITCFSSLSP